MRIITLTCPSCGTIVAANELEERRVTKCPGLSCKEVLRFENLAEDAQQHFLDNQERYRID